jgi:multisubunit Na+/H+ antiporter MnhE subunit
MSLTPGSYVLDADPETGDLLVHSLSSRGPRMERLVEP